MEKRLDIVTSKFLLFVTSDTSDFIEVTLFSAEYYYIYWRNCITFLISIMAHLSQAEILARREHATQDIIQEWQSMQGAEWYVLQCPCRPNCDCMPYNEVPCIILSQCLYVGELDFFFVEQPFFYQIMGFVFGGIVMNVRVKWHVGFQSK